ncbi:Protein SRC2 [Linum grandiflorum]
MKERNIPSLQSSNLSCSLRPGKSDSMEQITLEINLVSAQRLKNVNLVSKMDVYAVVSISGDPNHPSDQSATSPVDRTGGDNPSWNFPVKFTVDAAAAEQNRLSLVVKLRCERGLLGDKDVGEVVVPIKELLNGGRGLQFVSYQIRRPSGKSGGELTLSYKFDDQSTSHAAKLEVIKSDEPAISAYPAVVMGPTSTSYGGAYPPPPPPPAVAAGYGYPPPPPPQYVGYPPAAPAGYGYYPPPGPAGYGYPPVHGYGYGYPPQVVQPQQQQKKNKFGMGLGAGLLGGALGGLLIGDAVSDVAAYDAGYDSGFADAGGFGF